MYLHYYLEYYLPFTDKKIQIHWSEVLFPASKKQKLSWEPSDSKSPAISREIQPTSKVVSNPKMVDFLAEDISAL